MLRIGYCCSCRHCWEIRTKRNNYQCSRCKSRDVKTLASLLAFRDHIRTAAFDEVIDKAGKREEYEKWRSEIGKWATPGEAVLDIYKDDDPDPKDEDLELTEEEEGIRKAFLKFEREDHDDRHNIQWLMGRGHLNRFKAKELLDKFSKVAHPPDAPRV